MHRILAGSIVTLLLSACTDDSGFGSDVYVRVSDRLGSGWFVDKTSQKFASGWSEIYPVGWAGSPSIGVGAKPALFQTWTVPPGTVSPGPRGAMARTAITSPDLYDAFVFEMPEGVTFETVLWYVPIPGQNPPPDQIPVFTEALFCPDANITGCVSWAYAAEYGMVECLDAAGTILPNIKCAAHPPFVRWYARDASNFPVDSRNLEEPGY